MAPFGRVGEALDFQPCAGRFCETTARPRPAPFWLVVKSAENFLAAFGGTPGRRFADFKRHLAGAVAVRNDLDLSAHVTAWMALMRQIEQHLPEQLFVGLDGQAVARGHQRVSFPQVVVQGAQDFRRRRS